MHYTHFFENRPKVVSIPDGTVDVGTVTASSGGTDIPWGGTERTVARIHVSDSESSNVHLPDEAPVGVIMELWTSNNASPNVNVQTAGILYGDSEFNFGGAIFRKVDEGQGDIRWVRFS